METSTPESPSGLPDSQYFSENKQVVEPLTPAIGYAEVDLRNSGMWLRDEVAPGRIRELFRKSPRTPQKSTSSGSGGVLHEDVTREADVKVSPSGDFRGYLDLARHKAVKKGFWWGAQFIATFGAVIVIALAVQRMVKQSTMVAPLSAISQALGRRSPRSREISSGTSPVHSTSPRNALSKAMSGVRWLRWSLAVFLPLAIGSLVTISLVRILELTKLKRAVKRSRKLELVKALEDLYFISEKDDSSIRISEGDRKSQYGAVKAVRKNIRVYEQLKESAEKDMLSLCLQMAAESRHRQMRYAQYMSAADALQVKLEEGEPVSDGEEEKVFTELQLLTEDYKEMRRLVEYRLSAESLPNELCSDEREFLIRDLRPALVRLAEYTMWSLRSDKNYFKGTLMRRKRMLREAEEAEESDSKVRQRSGLSETDIAGSGARALGNYSNSKDINDIGDTNFAAVESTFWSARSKLSEFRRNNFTGSIPDINRCILPRLPLSLFAY